MELGLTERVGFRKLLSVTWMWERLIPSQRGEVMERRQVWETAGVVQRSVSDQFWVLVL